MNEKMFNLLMQNSFYNTFKQSMKDFSSQIHQQLMSVVAESHFYQWSLVCYSSFLQATTQVYPPKTEDPVQLTRLQERLLKKLGSNAYPFKFEVCFPLEILESKFINVHNKVVLCIQVVSQLLLILGPKSERSTITTVTIKKYYFYQLAHLYVHLCNCICCDSC